MNTLQQLADCGQAPWLDNLTRSLISQGGLQRLIVQDGMKGLTSNPSIFEKAIAESRDYDTAIQQFLAQADHGVAEIYEYLVIADIRAAADLLRPVHDQTDGRDGYVSLECSPYLADDTKATMAEAQRLWQAVARPNLMVKVPGTAAGIPAIRRLIGAGLNINVTLLFSVEVYEQVVEAYVAGLEDRCRAGGDISRIASVASIFVSRIDVAVDRKLDALGDAALADRLRGKAGIANAKLAYARYAALFAGPRWERLAAAGARSQRLLWASTSTKNPDYPDTMYVEALIGPDTVDTMPPATMDAFRDHGSAAADAIKQDLPASLALMEELATHGVSIQAVTSALVTDGVAQFAASFDTLLGAIAHRRLTLQDGVDPRQKIHFGGQPFASACAAEMTAWCRGGRIRQLWSGDASLWTGSGEAARLGWLQVPAPDRPEIAALRNFADEIRARGVSNVLLLGMGGSSLGPEVLGLSFGQQPGWPRFHMLDSTDPAQVLAVEQAVDLAHTLVIVSSKSGSTLEPNIFLDYFHARISALVGPAKAGAQFVAVTDPGSPLQARAHALDFAHVFHGEKAIGGRYSVLSAFGLVPAAALGIDIDRLLTTTQTMVRSCGADVPPAENPGVQLGIAMGIAAKHFGRDKVTIIAAPGIADFGNWLEQLLAESSGKQGLGLIPVAGEALEMPPAYESDRFFVFLDLESDFDPAQRVAVSAFEQSGAPVVVIRIKDVWCLGQEFFRWEIATAVACAVIGVNPFDQPDVEASKTATRALMDGSAQTGSPKADTPLLSTPGVALFADPRNAAELGHHSTLEQYLRSHFRRARGGDYVALLAYLQRDAATMHSLGTMRTQIRDTTHAATCLGFGPRFQHSTGQAYKGGPNTGVFLQITCDDQLTLEIPGQATSFGAVKAAQAAGDLATLVARGRRVLRVHLTHVGTALAELGHAVDAALQGTKEQ